MQALILVHICLALILVHMSPALIQVHMCPVQALGELTLCTTLYYCSLLVLLFTTAQGPTRTQAHRELDTLKKHLADLESKSKGSSSIEP